MAKDYVEGEEVAVCIPQKFYYNDELRDYHVYLDDIDIFIKNCDDHHLYQGKVMVLRKTREEVPGWDPESYYWEEVTNG